MDEPVVSTRGEQLRALVSSDVASDLTPPKGHPRRRFRALVSLRELWAAREIVRTLSERNLRVRYKQSLLGFAWALLTPVALLLVLTVVFEYGAEVDSPGSSYPLFAFVGLIPWTFFSAALSTGGLSIINDKALLNKCRFPREVFPLSAISVAAVDTAMTLVPLAGLFLWEGRWPAATVWLAVLPILVLLTFTAGLTLLVSCAVVYVRDVRHLLPLAVQIGLFVTPVAWDLDLVPERFRLAYCAVNPVAPVIDALRSSILLGEPPNWVHLGVGSITALSVALLGFLIFKTAEGGFADVA